MPDRFIGRLRTRIQPSFATNGVEVYIIETSDSGVTSVGKPIEMQARNSGVYEPCEPTFHLFNLQAQELMDQLWMAGYRPTEGSGSAGAMKQAEDHIKSLKSVLDRVLPRQ